jgi:hypothetical protein
VQKYQDLVNSKQLLERDELTQKIEEAKGKLDDMDKLRQVRKTSLHVTKI